MSAQNSQGPDIAPSRNREEPPPMEDCQAAADAVLERGYVMTTVVGEGGFDDVHGEAPPVDTYRLSTRPGVVSGGQ